MQKYINEYSGFSFIELVHELYIIAGNFKAAAQGDFGSNDEFTDEEYEEFRDRYKAINYVLENYFF